MSQFPKNFFWGVATSAHQIEGNQHNNWSEWEKQNAQKLAQEAPHKYEKISPVWHQIKDQAINPQNYISGQAANSYKLFDEDLALLKELGVSAYRFSLEWSRIEPAPGKFDEKAIAHYKSMLGKLRANNIEPFVTLWHWTSPVWVATQGGFENKRTVADYLKYVSRIVTEYKDLVRFWMPLNEPMIPSNAGYLNGEHPPGKRNPLAWFRVVNNLARAHNHAHAIIHGIRPDAQVGMPHAAIYAKGYQNKFLGRLLAKVINYFGSWMILNKIKDHTDFIGVQYYQTGNIEVKLGGDTFGIVTQHDWGHGRSDMGWPIYPQGLYDFCTELWKRYKKPLYITENGIADKNDSHRAKFITDHIETVARAIHDGIDIRGYFYWSLLDNFEWNEGFWPNFGLASVNRTTFKRALRPSAEIYKKIIQNNGI